MDYPIKTLNQLRPILQGFRKAAGLTQAMMASHLGVTQQTYAKLEANPAAASVERLFRVLRVLDVDLTLAHTIGLPPVADKQEGTPGKPQRAGPARTQAGTLQASGTGKKPEVQRSVKKTGGVSKKRENW